MLVIFFDVQEFKEFSTSFEAEILEASENFKDLGSEFGSVFLAIVFAQIPEQFLGNFFLAWFLPLYGIKCIQFES